MNGHDLDRARDALSAIPPDLARDDWVRVGMAAQAAGLTFDEFDAWSAQADNYEARAARDTWRSFKPNGPIGAGSLFFLARAEGWADTGKRIFGISKDGTAVRILGSSQDRPAKAPRRPTEATRAPRPLALIGIDPSLLTGIDPLKKMPV